MNGELHDAPNLQFGAFRDRNGWVVRIFAEELDLLTAFSKTFHRELVIDHGDHDVVVLGLGTSVNDQNVVGENAGTDHGITRGTNEELYYRSERNEFI